MPATICDCEDAINWSTLGEMSSHPAELDFKSVGYFSVSVETTGVRYMENGGEFGKYFL